MTLGTARSRVVLVTGGGSGIGRAIASAFLSAGDRVAIASRDPERLKKAAGVLLARAAGADAGRLLPLRLDVRVPEATVAAAAQVAEAWKAIDVLVNNAGRSGQSPVAEEGPRADELFHDILETNLHGAWRMTRACLPWIPEGGRIINVSSVLGKFGVARYGAYCASKHGLIGLTRALAAELAPRRITVNAVCPGWVQTAMADDGVRETAAHLGIDPQAFRKAANERVPLGRFLQPEEVAPLALYLASAEAEAVTGQAINIEGGATTW
ncbi:MAG TPA: SDR family oxidoreductase [Candidatus Polarisedimenticolia bacterium]|nr:SDR family oxidoreductase [Candidatus Polarisedimenticolia bacterium]